jgi:hypothetical protein
MPYFVPYPVIFWLAYFGSLIEQGLSSIPGFKTFLKPNLLIEFERVR